jgi:hypothetical protein
MTEYIGFDVHSKDTVYLGQERSGNVTAKGKASTTVKGFCHLIETPQLPKETKIGLETGPQAMGVARLLFPPKVRYAAYRDRCLRGEAEGSADRAEVRPARRL